MNDSTLTDTSASGPDHRDLYLLIAGIILGVLIGPAVLGRLAPDTYQTVFVGGESVARDLTIAQAKLHDDLQRLAASGVTKEALAERAEEERGNLIGLEAQLEQARSEHALELVGRTMAIIVAVLAVMVVETLVDPARPWLRGRLATARYGLLAIWVALLLAQPALLKSLPLLFAALLVAIALAAALVPLGKRRVSPRDDR